MPELSFDPCDGLVSEIVLTYISGRFPLYSVLRREREREIVVLVVSNIKRGYEYPPGRVSEMWTCCTDIAHVFSQCHPLPFNF